MKLTGKIAVAGVRTLARTMSAELMERGRI